MIEKKMLDRKNLTRATVSVPQLSKDILLKVYTRSIFFIKICYVFNYVHLNVHGAFMKK